MKGKIEALTLRDFANIFRRLEISDIRVEVREDGWYATMVDPGNVRIAEVLLRKDAWREYEFAPKTFAIDVDKLYRYAQDFRKGEVVEIVFEDTTAMEATFYLDGTLTRTFTLLDAEYIHKPKIPELEYKIELTLLTPQIKLIKDVLATKLEKGWENEIGIGVVERAHEEYELCLYASDDEGIKSKVCVPLERAENYLVIEPCASIYAFDYFKSIFGLITKEVGATETVTIQIGFEYPLRLSYEHKGIEVKQILLAPRIDEEKKLKEADVLEELRTPFKPIEEEEKEVEIESTATTLHFLPTAKGRLLKPFKRTEHSDVELIDILLEKPLPEVEGILNHLKPEAIWKETSYGKYGAIAKEEEISREPADIDALIKIVENYELIEKPYLEIREYYKNPELWGKPPELKNRVDTLTRYFFGGFGNYLTILSANLSILKDPAFPEEKKEEAKKNISKSFAWVMRKYAQIPFSELSKSPFYDDFKPLFEIKELLLTLEKELAYTTLDFEKIADLLAKIGELGKEYAKIVGKYYKELTGKDLGKEDIKTRALLEYQSKEQIQDHARWLQEQDIKPNSFEKAAMEYYGVEITEEEPPWRRLLGVIKELEKEHGLEVPEDVAIAAAMEVGIEKPKELIGDLKRDGILYSPAKGLIARVEREKTPEPKEAEKTLIGEETMTRVKRVINHWMSTEERRKDTCELELDNFIKVVTAHTSYTPDLVSRGIEELKAEGVLFTPREGVIKRVECEEEKHEPIPTNLIPYGEALRAYEGISQTPERSAEVVINDFYNSIRSIYDKLSKYAETETQKRTLDYYIKEFAEEYATRYRAILHQKAGLISPMVAGPSKFPTARMRKLSESIDKRERELLDWIEKQERRIKKAIEEVGVEEEGGEVAHLRNEIAKLNEKLERMKAINKIVKSKSLSDTEKKNKLAEMGYSQPEIDKLLTPDYMGKLGFPDYTLTSIRNKIKTREERIETLTEKEEKKKRGEEIIYERHGLKIIENPDVDRYQLLFEEKPDKALRDELKKKGFKWSPTNKAWQRMVTPETLYVIKNQIVPQWEEKYCKTEIEERIEELELKKPKKVKIEEPGILSLTELKEKYLAIPWDQFVDDVFKGRREIKPCVEYVDLPHLLVHKITVGPAEETKYGAVWDVKSYDKDGNVLVSKGFKTEREAFIDFHSYIRDLIVPVEKEPWMMTREEWIREHIKNVDKLDKWVRQAEFGETVDISTTEIDESFPVGKVLIYGNIASTFPSTFDETSKTIYINIDKPSDYVSEILNIKDKTIQVYYALLHEVEHLKWSLEGKPLNPYSPETQYEKYYSHPSEVAAREASTAFLKPLLDAHRKAVRQALSEGKQVPKEVLVDYPDLIPEEEIPEEKWENVTKIKEELEYEEISLTESGEEYLKEAVETFYDTGRTDLVREIMSHVSGGDKIADIIISVLLKEEAKEEIEEEERKLKELQRKVTEVEKKIEIAQLGNKEVKITQSEFRRIENEIKSIVDKINEFDDEIKSVEAKMGKEMAGEEVRFAEREKYILKNLKRYKELQHAYAKLLHELEEIYDELKNKYVESFYDEPNKVIAEFLGVAAVDVKDRKEYLKSLWAKTEIEKRIKPLKPLISEAEAAIDECDKGFETCLEFCDDDLEVCYEECVEAEDVPKCNKECEEKRDKCHDKCEADALRCYDDSAREIIERDIEEGDLTRAEEDLETFMDYISDELYEELEKKLPPEKVKVEEKIKIRVLEDIPTFMGTDGEIYELRKGDIVELPKTNAGTLVERGVAEPFVEKVREHEFGIEVYRAGTWHLTHSPGLGYKTYDEAEKRAIKLSEETRESHRVVEYDYEGAARYDVKSYPTVEIRPPEKVPEKVRIHGILKTRYRCPICYRAAPDNFCMVHSDVEAIDLLAADEPVKEAVIDLTFLDLFKTKYPEKKRWTISELHDAVGIDTAYAPEFLAKQRPPETYAQYYARELGVKIEEIKPPEVVVPPVAVEERTETQEMVFGYFKKEIDETSVEAYQRGYLDALHREIGREFTADHLLLSDSEELYRLMDFKREKLEAELRRGLTPVPTEVEKLAETEKLEILRKMRKYKKVEAEVPELKIGATVKMNGKEGVLVDISAEKYRVNWDDGTWDWIRKKDSETIVVY